MRILLDHVYAQYTPTPFTDVPTGKTPTNPQNDVRHHFWNPFGRPIHPEVPQDAVVYDPHAATGNRSNRTKRKPRNLLFLNGPLAEGMRGE